MEITAIIPSSIPMQANGRKENAKMIEKGQNCISDSCSKRYTGFLNAFWLKTSMLLPMTFDHIYSYFGYPEKLYFMHVLARIVAPVFAYLAAQGILYTRSRERYILRLSVFAAIMSVGNIVLEYITNIYIPNNIFFPLLLGFLTVYFIDKAKEGGNPPVYIAFAAATAMLSFYAEGQFVVPVMIIIFYFFHKDKPLMLTVYALSASIPYLLMYALTGIFNMQFYMIFAVIPIMLYNGERGCNNIFAKYLFYLFYPLHIWIIVLVSTFY